MKPRISMITLGVNDLKRSVQFYELGLGFPRMGSPPEVAFFTLNGTWLGLYGRDALADLAQHGADRLEGVDHIFLSDGVSGGERSQHQQQREPPRAVDPPPPRAPRAHR